MSVDPRFPVLDHFAYLNAGAVGPLSERTHQAMADANRLGLEQGRLTHGAIMERMAVRTQLRERVGELLGVPSTTVALTASTTEGCHIVIGGLDLQPGDEVVTTDAEHPALEGTLAACPAAIRVAPVLGKSPDEVVEVILSEITERTRLIALSHVLWLNGQVLPIGEIRRRSGLPLLVDGAQSVGAIPVTVTEADYYTVSGQKWLCGPELTGALYVANRESLRARQVLPPSPWHGGPTDASSLELLFHPHALLAGLLASLEERPADAVERGAAVTEACRQALIDAGIDVLTAAGQARLVSFRMPGPAEEVVAHCHQQGVMIRALPNGWLRASCGWWNSTGDVDRLVEALRSLP